MPEIDFVADEDVPETKIDFTPDPEPAAQPPPVAPRPHRAVIRPPAALLEDPFMAQTERKADLFAQMKQAQQQGEYWQGVADRIDTLTGTTVEPLSRPFSGAVGRAADVVVPGPPVIEPTIQQGGIHLPKLGEAETLPGKIGAGTYNAAVDLLSTLSNPDTVALLPAAGNKAVLTAWVSQMAGHQPERVLKVNQLFKEGKTQEAVQEVVTGVSELGLAELGRRHVMTPAGTPTRADVKPDIIDPTQSREIALQLTDPRQAQRRVVLPASMREAATPPRFYAPGELAPLKGTELAPEPAPVKPPEPVKAEVPVPAETPASAETLPEQFRTKPVAETVDLVKAITPEELAAYKGTASGGATGFMWDLGAKAKTPEDVAALRRIGEEASAETKRLMAAGDLEGAMKVIGRQPVEAYEYATGVKLDGTPKWETFEKMAAMKGQTYKPPVPDPQYLKAKGEAAPEPVVKESLTTAAPTELPTDLPSLARLRITKPELRPQIDAKIAELQGAAAPAAAILKDLPPVPAGHVRLFHGEGGPQGGGTGGAFYTSNVGKASTFGPDISWVDLPTDKAQAAFARAKESAFAGGDNFILEPAEIARSQKIGKKVEPPTHVLDEPAPAAKPAEAKPAEAPAAAPEMATFGGKTLPIPKEQWADMAKLNAEQQLAKYGTTRTRVIEEAVTGPKAAAPAAAAPAPQVAKPKPVIVPKSVEAKPAQTKRSVAEIEREIESTDAKILTLGESLRDIREGVSSGNKEFVAGIRRQQREASAKKKALETERSAARGAPAPSPTPVIAPPQVAAAPEARKPVELPAGFEERRKALVKEEARTLDALRAAQAAEEKAQREFKDAAGTKEYQQRKYSKDEAEVALVKAKAAHSSAASEVYLADWRASVPKTAPGAGEPTVTTKQLKGQKEFLLSAVDSAIKAAPEKPTAETPPKVTIAVPGDGTFTLVNDKAVLKNFREKARKEFPAAAAKTTEPGLPSVKGKKVPKAGEVDADTLVDVAGKYVSADESRFVLLDSYADGTQIIATDGKQMLRIVSDKAPGSPDAPVRFNAEGKENKAPAGKYPNWKQVMPKDVDVARGGVPIENLFHLARQSKALRDLSELDKEKRAAIPMEIFVNPDGSIGGRLKAQGDEFSHNVKEGAFSLGSFNPDFIENAMNAAAKLGNKQVDLMISPGNGLLVLRGEGMESMMMPIRPSGVKELPAPHLPPPAIAGKAVHPSLPEGYGPLETPEMHRSRTVGDMGKYTVEAEGDGLTISLNTREKDYRGNTVDKRTKLAETKLAELPEGDKTLPAAVKELLKEVKNVGEIVGAIKELRAERRAVEREVTTRRGQKGIAASVRKPGALEGGGETGAISLVPLQNLVRQAAPSVKAAVDAVKAISRGAVETGKEAISTERMTDYRRSVLNWSAKLQKSFDEAASAQKDIQTRVPNPVRREGITNWLQANGDAAVLRQRMIATADPKLKAGYQAALNLTPEELTVANRVRQLYDSYGQRGQASDVLDNFKENYVTQIWDLGKSRPGGSSSRTLKERFKFSKASTFPTFFDGEQAGYVPKTKDISKLLPVYVHEMNSVIAARQLVEQMSRGRASDGRPLVAPRGTAEVVAGSTTGPTLVMPDRIKGDTADYKVLGNQPALHAWRWASKDSAGNPIFLKGDLALHPEAFDKLKNVLGRSAIREWYSTPGSRVAAIPKGIVRGLDAFNSETKRTMLGMLAPFHQVQTGTHAVGHRVNPFGNIPKIDLVGDRLQMDAARHGLMLLPDRVSEGQFMEGFKTSGIISKIPGLGPLSDMYANYLFKQYIPGLKFKTYEAIVKRNREVYADELRAGTMKPEDVKVLSAEQANAAYGHLNYADISRNPTIQHMLQIGLLAPDFLEARGRFAGQAFKGATGAKVGREQLIALATLAVAQAAASFVSAKLSGGEWDADHPFEFHVGSRKYTMRSVPEDISGLIHNTRTFVHSRLSPIVGKGTLQYLSGVDYAGRRVTAGETTKELMTQPLPITARSLPGIRSVSGQDRPGSIEAWEQLAGAVGLKISRYNPRTKINELHADWMKNSKDPKVQADYEQSQTATYPVSKYKSLDSALADRNEPAAVKAINQLIEEGQKPRDILRRMRPFVGEGINSRQKPLFHESHKMETDFRNSLKPEELAEYKLALEERRLVYQEFLKAWRKRGIAVSAPAPELDFVPDAGQ